MGGVVELGAQSDVADDHLPGFDPDAGTPEAERRRRRRRPVGLIPGADRDRALHRAARMVIEVERGVENRMHGVADDLVDHAAVRDDRGGDVLEIDVEHRDQSAADRRGGSWR